jgi:outer membrane lipoprotein-sorting protein
MGELGDLLEALYRSRHSYRTFEAEYSLWRQEKLAGEAWEARIRNTASSGVIVSSASIERALSEARGVWRLWRERPDRVRSEFSSPSFGYPLSVRVGNRWWTYDDDVGAIANVGQESGDSNVMDQYVVLSEPAGTTGLLEFEPIGRGERLGRRVLRTLARPLPSPDTSYEFYWGLVGLAPDAEEYELSVDAERGVLLRVEARHHGTSFFVADATSVAFDERIPENTFVFQPPDAEEIRSTAIEPPDVNLSIDQAVARAPFPVFVPARVPSNWELQVSYSQPQDRPPLSPMVSLLYRSHDGTASVSISEFAAGVGDEDEVSEKAPPLERVERDGYAMEVRGRTGDWPQSTVELKRDGTQILMTSMNLPGETLVELAARLVPARSEPPRV